MMPEKFLPLGSVVKLKGGNKRMMIIGFCAVDGDNKEKTYDYYGCLYPEGVISADSTLLFDHEQIEVIYCIGYSDNEEKEFKNKLKEALQMLGNN